MSRGEPTVREALAAESGQAILLLLGVAAAAITGILVLAAFGQALGARGKHQRAADLAAVSAASAMREAYPRLFEPAYISLADCGGCVLPNPRHLGRGEYLDLARRAALRAGRRNGVPVRAAGVRFGDGGSFAPTRVRVAVTGLAQVEPGGAASDSGSDAIPVKATATAELVPPSTGGFGQDGFAPGGGYSGPLAYRMGKGMRPDVAVAFDRLAAHARSEAGLTLSIASAFRSDAEQARLFAANPDPRWVARPGTSLHRYGTELDLGPPAAYGWLARNSKRFGFIRRYSWEPWHFGYVHNAGTSSVGFGGGDGRGSSAIPSFVPQRFAPAISRAAQRWNISAALISAQIYAESNFNPFARSPAGAQGIAQFMPGTAHAYGLRNPYDPEASIDAQAHLMRDLLRRFAAVPLALAAYNAGPAPVAACGCVPPYPETRAYVAKILGLLGGAGELLGGGLEVRLVE